MEKRQMIVLWAGIAAIVLICLFPPRHYDRSCGDYRTDTGSLLARLVAVCAVTGGLIYTLKDKEEKIKKPESKQNKPEDVR